MTTLEYYRKALDRCIDPEARLAKFQADHGPDGGYAFAWGELSVAYANLKRDYESLLDTTAMMGRQARALVAAVEGVDDILIRAEIDVRATKIERRLKEEEGIAVD